MRSRMLEHQLVRLALTIRVGLMMDQIQKVSLGMWLSPAATGQSILQRLTMRQSQLLRLLMVFHWRQKMVFHQCLMEFRHRHYWLFVMSLCDTSLHQAVGGVGKYLAAAPWSLSSASTLLLRTVPIASTVSAG